MAAGTRLGPYEIVGPLGAGGMGEVYRARDTRLDRTVAVKVLPEHLSRNPDLRGRFEREARAVSSLNHPHICTLYDVGREDDTDYLVMEYLEGETLGTRLERGPLPAGELLRVAFQIAGALDAAHRKGLVHRDLKPGNVMLTPSGAKVLDFGLAKGIGPAGPSGALSAAPTATSPLTAEGSLVGTFQYMAPEQLEGREADARSDLFALGAVIYEMATGRPAFQGSTQASLIASILKEEPRPIAELQPMSPPALDRLVRACLTKDPDERWSSAGDLRRELEWLSQGGAQAEAGGDAGRVVTRSRSLRLAAAAGWIAAAAALAFVVLRPPPAVEAPVAVRAAIAVPEGQALNDFAFTGRVAVSPDGSRLAFVAQGKGAALLWVQDPATSLARPLEGTRGAKRPFWSPDGRLLAVDIETADGLNASAPRLLLDPPGGVQFLDVAPDGRLLVQLTLQEEATPPSQVIVHWTALLAER